MRTKNGRIDSIVIALESINKKRRNREAMAKNHELRSMKRKKKERPRKRTAKRENKKPQRSTCQALI
jgi:hypothetical protein